MLRLVIVVTVQDILNIIEIIAPESLAEEWDNVGLMIGDPAAEVQGIMVGLDPTLELLQETREKGANLLITHHPCIFNPLKTIHLGQPEGLFVKHAIRHQINVVSSHTNLDSTTSGVSDVLAGKLGLTDTVPLLQHPAKEECGLGRIGKYSEPLSTDMFLAALRKACSPPWLLSTSNRPREVRVAAVCGGSCSELARTALAMGADVFVTAEVKHSTARWAEQAGLWIIDAGHFATEHQVLHTFAEKLAGEVAGNGAEMEMHITREQKAPLQLA